MTPPRRGVPFWSAYPCDDFELWHPFVDHIADYLLAIHLQRPIVLVYAQHEHDHGCHITSRIRLDPKDYEVVSPLVVPPWCRLVMPAGCCIRLLSSSHCAALSLSCRASWLLHLPLAILSLRCPLIVLVRKDFNVSAFSGELLDSVDHTWLRILTV